MNNNLIGGVSDIKYVNLPVNIKSYVRIPKDYINNLELEYGSTYSFIISYGYPLTNKGIPYNPLKLTMVDTKGPLYIQNSVLKDTSISNGWTLDDYTLIYENVKGWKNTISVGKKGELVSYKEILYASIWALVTKSDLIRGIDANSIYETKRDTVVRIGVPGHDVINMSLAYYKTTA